MDSTDLQLLVEFVHPLAWNILSRDKRWTIAKNEGLRVDNKILLVVR